MKTVFKVGMKVYDQFNSPEMEGVVVEVIDNECDDYPIVVSFQKYDIYYYTPEGRFNKSDIPTLSTKPYKVEFQGFEQKAPAKTYEEALKEAHKKGEYCYLSNDLQAPSEKLANAIEALLKLLFLRDYYNEGWQSDLKNKEQRGISVILDCEGNFFVWGVLKETETHVLVFKDEKVAKRFIEEQKELLEIAKPLL